MFWTKANDDLAGAASLQHAMDRRPGQVLQKARLQYNENERKILPGGGSVPNQSALREQRAVMPLPNPGASGWHSSLRLWYLPRGIQNSKHET